MTSKGALSLALATLLMMNVGCSSMRMRYTATVQDQSGKVSQFEYEKSYQKIPSAVVCGVTAIIYGGWCWAYLAMPFGPEQTKLAEDANAELKSRYPGTFVKSEKIERVSWSGGSAQSNMTPMPNMQIGSMP